MKHLPTLLTALFISLLANAQPATTLPKEAEGFVLKGYEMMDYVTGDLDGDKKMDAILILKEKGENEKTDELKRPLFLLIRQANGKLKLAKRNDELVMCFTCGGVFGDPYSQTVIANNGFTIDFYGGSNWRWEYSYRFNYDAAKQTWVLVSERQESYHTSDPDAVKTVKIPAVELDGVTIDNYHSTSDVEGKKWQVTAAKTYFYDSPLLNSKPRKGYLLKGDKVTVYRELKNFVQVDFENSKNEFTYGYVLKKDLKRL